MAALENVKIPSAWENDPEIVDYLNNMNSLFEVKSFTPQYTNFTNVGAAYGRYQRLGDLCGVWWDFVDNGTAITITATTSTLTTPLTMKNLKSTGALINPSNFFLVGETGGVATTWFHPTNNNTIVADVNKTSTTNGFTIQGFFWVND